MKHLFGSYDRNPHQEVLSYLRTTLANAEEDLRTVRKLIQQQEPEIAVEKVSWRQWLRRKKPKTNLISLPEKELAARERIEQLVRIIKEAENKDYCDVYKLLRNEASLIQEALKQLPVGSVEGFMRALDRDNLGCLAGSLMPGPGLGPFVACDYHKKLQQTKDRDWSKDPVYETPQPHRLWEPEPWPEQNIPRCSGLNFFRQRSQSFYIIDRLWHLNYIQTISRPETNHKPLPGLWSLWIMATAIKLCLAWLAQGKLTPWRKW